MTCQTGVIIFTTASIDKRTMEEILDALIFHSGERGIVLQERDGITSVLALGDADLVRMALDTIRHDFACLRQRFAEQPVRQEAWA